MSRQDVGERTASPGTASPDGLSAVGNDEGTARSVARRQPDAGIVKGRASAP